MSWREHRRLHDRDRERDPDGVDPELEGAHYRLAPDVARAIWERVSREATDTHGRRDTERALRRFHQVAAAVAARGGRLAPPPGRVPRVGGHGRSRTGRDPFARIAPGKVTRVMAERSQRSALSRPPNAPPPSAQADGVRDDRRAAIEAVASDALSAALGFLGGDWRCSTALPDALRARLSRQLGVDLSGVRIHSDGSAARAAARIGARAFTVGMHVYFADGAYDPNSEAGIELIAQEMAHVAQHVRGQATGAPSPADGHGQAGDQIPPDVAAREPRFADPFAVGLGGVGVGDPSISLPQPALARHGVQGIRAPVEGRAAEPARELSGATDGIMPVPDRIRGELESATGQSLGDVRVHAGARGNDVATAHGARAVTFGGDIYMADGELDAGSPAGRELIAHEVAHVVQARIRPDPGQPAAMSRDDDEHAAEVEADQFAAGFRDHGGALSWRPTVRVESSMPMRRVAQPASKPDRVEDHYPGPRHAALYFGVHERRFFEAIRTRLASVVLPAPHERLVWVGGPDILAAGFEPALMETTGGWKLHKLLPGLLYPIDPWRVIDQHRDLAEGRPGELVDGKPARGTIEWTPIAGQALAVEMEGRLRESLPRMGLRYVAQADERVSGDVGAGELVASHPLDRVVARLLCDPQVARHVRVPKRGQPRARALARGAFQHGLRLTLFEWQGEHDPALWNWVKATEPADATTEEVAASVFERMDGENHSELAYGLIASPPFFRIPAKWALEFPLAAKHAPRLAQELDLDRAGAHSALALAASQLGDDAAIAQAARYQRGVPVSAEVDQLARMLDQSAAQIALVRDAIAPAGLADLVGPALRWVARHREQLLDTAPTAVRRWAPIIEGQRALLFEATGELLDVLQTAHRVALDAAEGEPVREVVQAFAIAIGESHLLDSATAQLARARQAKAWLPLTLLDRAQRANHDATQDLIEQKVGITSAADRVDQSAKAREAQTSFELGAIDLRAKLLAGERLDPLTIETLAIATAETAFRSRMHALDAKLDKVKQAAWDADDSGKEKLANTFSSEIKELPRTLLSAQTRVFEIVQAMSDRTMQFVTAGDRPQDPATYQAGLLATRRQSLATAQREIADMRKELDLDRLLTTAIDVIRSAQLRVMLLDIALLIGVSVIGGLAATAVRGAVRGAALADAAVDTLAFARGAAVARSTGFAAGVVTDASINAIGQSVLFGDNTTLSFGENLLSNLGVVAALRRLHAATRTWGKLDDKAMGLWKAASYGKVGLVKGGIVSVEMLTGAAVGYVASRLVRGEPPPSDAVAASWAIQGASMVVGRFVSGRFAELDKRLALFAERGVHLRQRAKAQRKLAEQLETSGRSEDALALLDEHVRLLEGEAALLGDRAAVALLKLDPDQLAALRAGNAAAVADTRSQAYGVMRLHFHGLEPVAASGAVWLGTAEQIRAALVDAGSAASHLSHDAANRRWSVRLGGRELVFVETDHGAPLRPAARSGHSADPAHATSPRGDVGANGARDPAGDVDHLGLQIAATVGNTRYVGEGVFEVQAGARSVGVEVRRTRGPSRIRRERGKPTVEIKTGLEGIELERAVVARLTEVQHQELRIARGEKAAAESALGAKGSGHRLSPADMGAVAELRVLRRHHDDLVKRGGDGPARAQQVKQDIEAIETRLGLRDQTPDGERRRNAVEAQIAVQNDASRRARAARELEGERGHPGIELHTHFVGIVDAPVFRARAATAAGGDDTGSWIPLLERIAGLKGGEFEHETGPKGEITRRASAGDAVKIAQGALKQVETLKERARASEDPQDRAAFRRAAEVVAEEASTTALRATQETAFSGAYEIRDQLVKETFGTHHGEPVDIQARYDDFIREAVLQLARDGIGYAEPSTGLSKLGGVLGPRRIEAAIAQLIQEGKLLPGQVDIRMLGMTQTGYFGSRDPDLPPVRALDRDKLGDDVDTVQRQMREPGTVGKDIGGAELYRWDERARSQFMDIYRRFLAEAVRTGTPSVLRPHVGEGAIDTVAGKPFHTDKDRITTKDELAHYERARSNIEQFVQTLETLRAAGALDPTKVIIRLGHVTHARPDQVARMRALGVIAEVNLGSNVATSALSQTQGVHGPRSPVERFDDHSLATLLYYDVPIAISTDGGPVMGTTLRSEYQRARQIIEEVLAGARPVRVRAQDAQLAGGPARGRPSPGREGEHELSIHELTPDERARFLRGYEKLYADAETYYRSRPKPRATFGNVPGAVSPKGGAHHVDLAAKHGLVPSMGTTIYEGVRADVEQAARAYRGAGYFVTEQVLAGDRVLVVVRSADGTFETTLRSWAGDGPAYLPVADLGPLDPKLASIEVRRWYKAALERVAPLNERWMSEGVPLSERARRAFEVRRSARLLARELMESRTDVTKIELRDLFEYGDTDGPSFEALVERHVSAGRTREQAYQAILDSAPTSNKQYDRRSGVQEPRS